MQVTNLSNGLTLICYPISHAQSVEIGLYIKAGSRYETKNNNGITHLLEHMHFRQLGNMSQEEIYKNAECIGTSLSGTTYKEIMQFHMKIRPDYLEKGMDFFEKILTTYYWTEEQFESEKKIVQNELREKEDSLEIQTIIDEAIWSDNSLSKQVLGRKKIIEKISLEKLINYKKEIFCKNNMAVVITGAIKESEIDVIAQRLEKILLNENQIKQNHEKQIKKKTDVQFERKPRIRMENYSAWDLLDIQLSFDVDLKLVKENEILFLNSIIGGGDGSVLQKKIREEMGLVYDIYSYVEVHSGAAVLSISFSIDKKSVYTALEAIMSILSNLKMSLSQAEIDTNRVFFTDNLWFWTEDTHELNFQLGSDFVKGNELLTIEQRIDVNKNVNYIRLREVANIIFHLENMSLIILGPTKNIDKDKLKKKLQILTQKQAARPL